MKHIKGYRHYQNTKNSMRSTINRIVENSYEKFNNKSNHYQELGESDNRNIFEICLSTNEYDFLKENMKVDEINTLLIESISMVVKLSNDDLINEGLLDGLKKKIGDSYDKAVNWVGDKVDKAVEFGSIAVTKMKDIIANITDIVSNLYKQVKSSLSQMWSFLGTQFAKITNKMKSGIKKAGDAKIKAIKSILESDNLEKESVEAKKDFLKVKEMISGGKLSEQSEVESTLKGKADEFKDLKSDELENIVISDVTSIHTESIVNLLKGLVLENGYSILGELSESLRSESTIDKINEKDGVSSKSIFSWVLEGVSVIISWKSKLIEKLTKIGTNFMMNFMSHIARGGQGTKYVLMGQVVAFVIALVYEMMHLVHELHDVGHESGNTEHTKDVVKTDDNISIPTKESKINESSNKDIIDNMNIGSMSPDKIVSAVDWASLKFAGLSIVFTLAIKTLLPQLSVLFTIVGVCVCSFELIESICTMSKSHSGVCKSLHGIENFANSLFSSKSVAH